MIIKSHDPKNPEGSVLLFALIVMLLMGLMTTAIFLNTRTEMSISQNTNQGREAFTKADAAARLAIQLTRVLLNPSLGSPDSYLSNSTGNSPFTVQPWSSDWNNFTLDSMMDLAGDEAENDVVARYQAATALSAGDPAAGEAPNHPHLIIRQGGERGPIVGTAAISVAYLDNQNGGSLSGSAEYGGMGNPVTATITVTATGRLPQPGEGANSDFYSGSPDAPHSVITMIYKDKVN